jgi:hypothetical protein
MNKVGSAAMALACSLVGGRSTGLVCTPKPKEFRDAMRPNGKRPTEEPPAKVAYPMPPRRDRTVDGHGVRQCSPDWLTLLEPVSSRSPPPEPPLVDYLCISHDTAWGT